MNFSTGQQIILGGNKYEIKQILGSGAIAVAYLAVPDISPESKVVIKVAHSGLDVDNLEAQNALNGLRNEAQTLRVLNQAEHPDWKFCTDLKSRLEIAHSTKLQRRVVALLDWGDTDTQQPYQVQEKAPEAIGSFDIKTLADEWQLIKVMDAVLDVMVLAHKNGISLKDFEPNTKSDRVRLAWLDDNKNFELKIIDWNVTGGSEGAAQDLLYFGGHLFRLLFNHNITFEGKERNLPPLNLSALTRNWGLITEGTRQILQKLLQRDPQKRYPKVDDLKIEFKWWLEVLQDAYSPDGFSTLQNYIWDLKRQERFNQVLAVADLAMRVFPPEEARPVFLPWDEQARQELEKREILPIARARGTLMTGSFDKAALEFERELSGLAPDSEVARQANIYIVLARTGEQMKKALGGVDIRNMPEWLAVERGVDELIKRRPDMALMSFKEASQLRPEIGDSSWFQSLNNKAVATRDYNKACDELSATQPSDAKSSSDDWLKEEQNQVEQRAETLGRIKQAQELDPRNPEIRARYEDEQAKLKQRKDILRRHETIQQYMVQGEDFWQKACAQLPPDSIADSKILDLDKLKNFESLAKDACKAYQDAQKECGDILNTEPAHSRTQYQREQIKRQLDKILPAQTQAAQRILLLAALNELRPKARSLMEKGFYSQARDALSLSRQTIGAAVPELQELETEANFGSGIENQVNSKWETVCQDYFPNLRARDAEVLLQKILGDANKPLSSFLGGELLPAMIANRTFVLNEDLRKKADLSLSRITSLKDCETRVADGRGKPDGQPDLIAALQDAQSILIKSLDIELSAALRQLLEGLQGKLDIYSGLKTELERHPDFDRLQTIIDELGSDDSVTAQELREIAVDCWDERVAELTDEKTIEEKLSLGIQLFRNQDKIKSLSKRKEQMEKLVGTGKTIQLEAGRSYPTWMTDESDMRLSRCIDDLNSLGNETWPFLRDNANLCKTKLANSYETYVREYVDRLGVQAAQSDASIEAVLNELQQHKRVDALLSDKCKQEILSLRRDLTVKIAYEQNEQAFGDDPKRLFTETYLTLKDVILDGLSDVALARYEKILGAWEKASMAEQVLGRTLNPTDPFPYVSLIDGILDEQARLRDSELKSRPRLNDRLEKLQSDLSGRKLSVLKELRETFSSEAYKLQEHPENNPAVFLKLYWQIRWYRAHVVNEIEKGQIANVLGQRVNCHQKMNERVVALLGALNSEKVLTDLLGQVATLQEFLRGLRERPLDLQPFRKTDDYDPSFVPDLSEYESAHAQLSALEKTRNTEISDLAGAISALESSGSVLVFLNSFSNSISYPIVSRGDSPTQQLNHLASNVLLPTANLMKNIDAQSQQAWALNSLLALENEGRALLDALVKDTAGVWLFGKYQNFLQGEFKRLQDLYRDSLQGDAQEYLRKDIGAAPDNLWEKMMSPCGGEAAYKEIRGLVRDAIVKAGDQESGTVSGKKDAKVADKGSARRIWHAISLASAKGQAVEEWKKLHEIAVAQEKSLSGPDPRLLWAFALIVLLLVTFGGWGVSSYKANNDSTLAVLNAENTHSMQTSQAQTATATIQIATDTALAKTQQAIASSTQAAQAATQAFQVASTQIAVNTANARAATAVYCDSGIGYKLEILDPQAQLQPGLGTVYIQGDPEPEASATWKVKITGACPWSVAKLGLKHSQASMKFLRFRWTENGAKQSVEVSPDGNLVFLSGNSTVIPVGQQVEITGVLAGISQAARDLTRGGILALGNWTLMSGSSTTIGQLSLELPKGKLSWVIYKVPTLTPTYVPPQLPTRKPDHDGPKPVNTAKPPPPP